MANMKVAMSSVLNLEPSKIKEVLEKESPGVNTEKGISVIMMMKGMELEKKADIPSTHEEYWKKFQTEIVGKEIDFKQSLVDFNHFKKIDDEVWKHITEIMVDSELDQKVIKYQTNPASCLITWANASFHLISALRKVPEDKIKEMETLHNSQKGGYKVYYFDVMARAESTRVLMWKWGVPYEDKRLAGPEWGEMKQEVMK